MIEPRPCCILTCSHTFAPASVSLAALQNGRLKGDAKVALRGVIERYELPVTLTANQNIILRDVQPAWKEDIQATLEVRRWFDCCLTTA